MRAFSVLAEYLLFACLAVSARSSQDVGQISGIVVNASGERSVPSPATVVLRVLLDGQYVPVDETTSDGLGRFVFTQLPVGADYRYRAGANRHGVHYPGPSVQLTAAQPHARVDLTVYDAVQEPNPLTIRRQEIDVRSGEGVLRVTESILIENRSKNSYVGRAEGSAEEPVTLQLQIPADFERVTFDEEFLGRRFSLVEGKLVTAIPWLPGERMVKFTYLLRNDRGSRTWQRPLDLPCSALRLTVHGPSAAPVSCNLSPPQAGPNAQTIFESPSSLPAGYLLQLELGRLSVPPSVYLKWAAPGLLIALIGGSWLLARYWRRERCGRTADPTESSPERASRGPRPCGRAARRHRLGGSSSRAT